jgi:Flp pilus assembly protein TadD
MEIQDNWLLMFIRNCSIVTIVLVSLSITSHSAPAQTTTEDARPQILEHTRKAQEYLREKKPDLAIPELRSIVALNPGDLNARTDLGVLLFFQGDYSGAIPQLQEAVNSKPDLWKIRALLGMSEKRIGNPKDAVINLENAFPQIDEKEIRIQAGFELIEADAALGQLDKAASVAGTLRELAPEDPQVLSTAYQIYSQLLNETLLSMAVVAPESAEMHRMIAQQMDRLGNDDGALQQYRQALKMKPNLPGLHFEYAQVLNRSYSPTVQAEAESEYNAAVAANKFDEKAECGLGDIAAKRHDLKAAAAHYSRALQLKPNDASAMTDMARVLISTDDKSNALPLLESAIKVDPTNFVAHYMLFNLYRQMGRIPDAKHELGEFQHYKDLSEKLQNIFPQMRAQTGPPEADGNSGRR